MNRDVVASGKEFIRTYARQLDALADGVGAQFGDAVDAAASVQGLIVVTGLGKSGLVGRKISATLVSVGVSAVFLHAADALHGDAGILDQAGLLLAISNSGTTRDVLTVAGLAQKGGCLLVALTGDLSSPLALRADHVLDATVDREAGPLGVVPTSSVIAATAVGDAWAMAIVQRRGISLDALARHHPEGAIGRGLSTVVEELVTPPAECARLRAEDLLRTAIVAMTARPLGAALVLQTDGTLAGLLTDGDLRRAMDDRTADLNEITVGEVMTREPRFVPLGCTAIEALRMLERHPPVYVAPVGDSRDCRGLLRMHDLVQVGLAPGSHSI